MNLDLVWLIFREDSEIAKDEARVCVKELQSIGVKVLIAVSGPSINPFPKLSGLVSLRIMCHMETHDNIVHEFLRNVGFALSYGSQSYVSTPLALIPSFKRRKHHRNL